MPRNKIAYESVNSKMFQISSFAVVDQNAHFGSVFRLGLIKGLINSKNLSDKNQSNLEWAVVYVTKNLCPSVSFGCTHS